MPPSGAGNRCRRKFARMESLRSTDIIVCTCGLVAQNVGRYGSRSSGQARSTRSMSAEPLLKYSSGRWHS